jgi:RNA polymerase sigma-70 factor (ECF subfamily)
VGLGAERKNLKELRQGRRKVYEAAVLQHYRSIYRFMAYLTRDTELAEELTQETFASAWANIDSFKARSSFKTWLHRIAYRKFIDSKRSQRRDAAFVAALDVENDNATQASDPLQRLTADEHTHLLYEAMHSLKQDEYIAILLHYIQGLSFRQVAKVLNLPVGTVKWQNSRALKTLRQYLSGRV